MTVKLGLIGAGRVMNLHAEALERLDVFEVVAVADPRHDAAARLAQRFGVSRVFDRHTGLLAVSEIDAVDIALPHHLHYQVASAALRAGKHVFLDKPLATNLVDGGRLQELADDSDLAFMVCHNLLFHPLVLEAKRLVADGFLGRITTSAAWSRGWLDLPETDFRKSREATGGGAWFDSGSHLLYVLEAVIGSIEHLVVLPSRTASRIEAEDSASGVAAFANGSTATVQVSYSDHIDGAGKAWPDGFDAGFTFNGTKGTVDLQLLPTANLRTHPALSGPRAMSASDGFLASFEGAFAEFANAISYGRRPTVSAEDALRMLTFLLDAMQGVEVCS